MVVEILIVDIGILTGFIPWKENWLRVEQNWRTGSFMWLLAEISLRDYLTVSYFLTNQQ